MHEEKNGKKFKNLSYYLNIFCGLVIFLYILNSKKFPLRDQATSMLTTSLQSESLLAVGNRTWDALSNLRISHSKGNVEFTYIWIYAPFLHT